MTHHRPEFHLNRPGALIAALPAVLGFVPEKSLVLVGVDRGEMGAVLRIDLSDDVADALSHLAELAAAGHSDAVIAVIVDAAGARCPMCNEEYRELCADLAAGLQDCGISLLDAHVVDRIDKGGRWHCVDGCGATGGIDDPSSSPLTLAAVLDGRRLYANRAELEAVIAVADTGRGGAISAAIEQLAAGGLAARTADPDGSSRRAVQDALLAADRTAGGAPLREADIAALGYALTDVIVRDVLFGLAAAENAAAAESLFAALSRALPAPWRVEALTLLGFFAYVRGDGPLAGVALDAALRIDPFHRMAVMLDTALQSGMRPEQIRHLTRTGYRLAERIGVKLPPRQSSDRRAG
jgi:hypothetical protein